jgi:uncharacterized protein
MARADAFGRDGNGFAVHGGSVGASIGNSPEVFFELGIKYACGREVPADLVVAHKWFNLAALRGNAAARDYRAEIARDMSRAQVATAQKLAREYLANGI